MTLKSFQTDFVTIDSVQLLFLCHLYYLHINYLQDVVIQIVCIYAHTGLSNEEQTRLLTVAEFCVANIAKQF